MSQTSPWRRPVPAKALLALGVAAVLGGLVIGSLAYVVGRFVYVAVLFPLGMAYVGTAVIDWAVTRGRVRNPLIAALSLGIGFLMTLAGDKKQALHDVIAGSVVVETGG